MPSGYLHSLIAQRASALSGITPVDQSAFSLGTLMPDLFFFLGMFPLRLSSKPSKFGNRLHTLHTGQFLLTLCQKAKEGDDAQRAFALGYLTHYALDSGVHPYVYSRSYKPDGAYSSSMHMKLERLWDGFFYRRENGRGQPHLFQAAADSRRHWTQIAALMSDTICAVFPQDSISADEIISVLDSAVWVNRLLYSPLGGKYALCWLLERIIGKPRLLTSQLIPVCLPSRLQFNVEHLPWNSPFEEEKERTESVFDLLDASTRRGASLMLTCSRWFDDEISQEDFAREIGNFRYDSGLPCQE